jgi:DNA-binding Lrp family transcriptional regulator
MVHLKDLDLKDRKLLYELDSNSRQTYLQIAKKIGLSKDSTIYRINRLIKRGIIGGFYTLIENSKLGYFTVRVYVKFQNTTNKDEKEIVDYVCNLANSLWVGSAEIHWNFVFGIWVKDLYEFDNFWLDFNKKYKPKIRESKVSIFVRFTHFRRNYLLGKRKSDLLLEKIGSPETLKLDFYDLKILSALANNARVSSVAIGKKINLTPKAIRLRIKRLEKKQIILGYKTKINLDAVNYQYYKVDLTLKDLDKLKELEAFTLLHPNITYSERALGGSDFEFDIECENFNSFLAILKKLKNKLGESISYYQYYLATKIHKTLYFPKDP